MTINYIDTAQARRVRRIRQVELFIRRLLSATDRAGRLEAIELWLASQGLSDQPNLNPQFLLSRAEEIIKGEKRSDYGTEVVSFCNFAFLAERDGFGFSPYEACRVMLSLKGSRLVNQPEHEDTNVDIVAYSLLGARLLENRRVVTRAFNQLSWDYLNLTEDE